jgi:hypothetical protein
LDRWSGVAGIRHLFDHRIVQTIIGIVGLLVNLTLLWSGRERLRFGSLLSTSLSLLALLGTVIAVISLGWLGFALLAVVNLAAILVWSCVLALRVEEKLRFAATETRESIAEMKELAKRLRQVRELKAVQPTEQVEMIKLLAERSRSGKEIEEIAPALGTLLLLHDPPLPWLVEYFDRLLRLAGEPASKAMEAAATLSASTRNAAASFSEMLEAMITVYSGEIPAEEAA